MHRTFDGLTTVAPSRTPEDGRKEAFAKAQLEDRDPKMDPNAARAEWRNSKRKLNDLYSSLADGKGLQ